MKEYADYLTKKKYKVTYIEFNKKIPKTGKETYQMFDPIDKIKMTGYNINLLESPNFLLTKEDYVKFKDYKKSPKTLFNTFYMFGKKEADRQPQHYYLPTLKTRPNTWEPNYTPGVNFWTIILYNLEKFKSRSI